MKLFQAGPDQLSNRALDAIEAGRYDKAEKLCQRLLCHWPELFDGHERLALLRQRQGRFQEAADHYSEVLGMIQQEAQGTDAETLQHFTQCRDRALRQAQP
jgi:tetratricopeptide (TPR) repeat protein